MPLMRNPFRKAPGDVVTDPNDSSNSSPATSPRGPPRGPSSMEIPKPTEYKLSEINDSGVFLPPSPPAHDKPRFWTTRSTTSTSSSSYRSAITEDDSPFTISRESFDSYRRSFDISARSPITDHDASRPRHSLDAARLRVPPQRLRNSHPRPPSAPAEDCFEDVGLGDETAKTKKPGIFSRFGGSHAAQDAQAAAESPRPASSHFARELFSRRRGPNGAAAEMGSMSRPPGQAEEAE